MYFTSQRVDAPCVSERVYSCMSVVCTRQPLCHRPLCQQPSKRVARRSRSSFMSHIIQKGQSTMTGNPRNVLAREATQRHTANLVSLASAIFLERRRRCLAGLWAPGGYTAQQRPRGFILAWDAWTEGEQPGTVRSLSRAIKFESDLG